MLRIPAPDPLRSLRRRRIIMSTRNQAKMFNIKHLQKQHVNGIIIFFMRESVPICLKKPASFPIWLLFSPVLELCCPIDSLTILAYEPIFSAKMIAFPRYILSHAATGLNALRRGPQLIDLVCQENSICCTGEIGS